MKNEKVYGAMVRLNESMYFELRKIALDHRSTFNRFTRQILEQYLAAHRRGVSPEIPDDKAVLNL